MYSRYQTVSMFFSTLPKKIREAFSLDAEDNINNMIIDLGESNLINIGGIDIRRLQARNPLNGAVILRQPNILPSTATRSSLLSSTLESFIDSRRHAEIKNSDLSERYEQDAADYQLNCPILFDFPLIPVLFNGTLYDYDSLMKLAQNGVISDPRTNEEIQLAPHVIQPHFDAQKRMDDLLNEMMNKNLQTNRPN